METKKKDEYLSEECVQRLTNLGASFRDSKSVSVVDLLNVLPVSLPSVHKYLMITHGDNGLWFVRYNDGWADNTCILFSAATLIEAAFQMAEWYYSKVANKQ